MSAPSSSLRISPATADDLIGIGELYGLVCLPSAFQQALYSQADPDLIVRRVTERMAKLAFEKGQRLFKAEWDGQLAGYAWWTEPASAEAANAADESLAEPAQEKPKEDYPAGVKVDLMNGYRETLAQHKKTLPARYYELNMLGVHPDFQRKGIASSLFSWGVEQATKARVDLHLSASEAGIPLYTRHGLVKSAEPLWLADHSAAFYPMVLKPQSTTKSSLAIAPATLEDIPTLAAVFFAAFMPFEPQPTLYGKADYSEVVRLRAKAWSKQAFLPGNEIRKAVRGGEVVGFAWWAERSASAKADDPVQEETAEKDDEPEFAPGTRTDLIDGFREDLKLIKQSIDKAYYELNYIGVLPAAQKTGVAAALMKEMIAHVTSKALDLRFCSSKEGMSMYEKFGAVPYADPIWMRDRSAAFTPMIISYTRPNPKFTPTPLTILPVEESDLPRCAELYATAFHPGVFGQALWAEADPAEMARLAAPRLRKKWANKKERMFKGVNREGKIVGWAWWTTPTWPEEEDEEKAATSEAATAPAPVAEGRTEYAAGTKVELLDLFSSDLEAHEDTLTGPHYYLQQLGTDANHQRQGIAAQMIKWGLDAAKKDGVPLYLDATIEGIKLYERMGCKRFAEPVWIRDQSAAFYPMVFNGRAEDEARFV